MATEAEKRAYKKYHETEKGKETLKRYQMSEKGRAKRAAAAKRRYDANPDKFRKRVKEAKARVYPRDREKILVRVRAFARTIEGRYMHLKGGAKRRKLEFSISFEQYEKLVSPNSCFYCLSSLPETGGGLDKIDWKAGYVFENVVVCCKSCNDKKGALERIGFLLPRIKELLKELNGN